jgi:WD40 repeat protein
MNRLHLSTLLSVVTCLLVFLVSPGRGDGRPPTVLTARSPTGDAIVVLSVAFSPDGKKVAGAASNDRWGSIFIWDVASGRQIGALNGHTHYVYTIDISRDGKTLASGSRDGTIRLWNFESGKLGETLIACDESGAESLAFAPNSKIFASDYKHQICIWNVPSANPVATIDAHERDVQAVDSSPDGKVVASGGFDEMVKLWDVSTGTLQMTLRGHENPVNSVAFSRDGKYLASSDSGQGVLIWDLASGQSRNVRGPKGFSLSVAFSPDSKQLAISDWHDILLFDVASGQRKKTLKGHRLMVRSLVFSPDGTLLASGSLDDTVRLWPIAKE